MAMTPMELRECRFVIIQAVSNADVWHPGALFNTNLGQFYAIADSYDPTTGLTLLESRYTRGDICLGSDLRNYALVQDFATRVDLNFVPLECDSYIVHLQSYKLTKTGATNLCCYLAMPVGHPGNTSAYTQGVKSTTDVNVWINHVETLVGKRVRKLLHGQEFTNFRKVVWRQRRLVLLRKMIPALDKESQGLAFDLPNEEMEYSSAKVIDL